jgi:DNA polymerase II large subunit
MITRDMETWKFVVEIAMAVFTAAMAGFTAWLACETRKLEKSWRENSTKQIEAWHKTSSNQIAVKAWFELVRRFDSEEMKRARKKLAQQIKTYSVSKHDRVSETVLNFFEDVGTLYKEGYLDKKLASSTFSFHVCRWWEAARPYANQEQKRHGEDATIFEDFKVAAESMRLPGEVIDAEEIQRFLEDEMKLD